VGLLVRGGEGKGGRGEIPSTFFSLFGRSTPMALHRVVFLNRHWLVCCYLLRNRQQIESVTFEHELAA